MCIADDQFQTTFKHQINIIKRAIAYSAGLTTITKLGFNNSILTFVTSLLSHHTRDKCKKLFAIYTFHFKNSIENVLILLVYQVTRRQGNHLIDRFQYVDNVSPNRADCHH